MLSALETGWALMSDIEVFVAMYECLLPLLSFGTAWPTIFSLLISSVTASCCARSVVMRMFSFFNVARPGQLSSTHFKYFTSFSCCIWRTVVLYVHKSSRPIARNRINIRHYVYCLTVLRTIGCLLAIIQSIISLLIRVTKRNRWTQ